MSTVSAENRVIHLTVRYVRLDLPSQLQGNENGCRIPIWVLALLGIVPSAPRNQPLIVSAMHAGTEQRNTVLTSQLRSVNGVDARLPLKLWFCTFF